MIVSRARPTSQRLYWVLGISCLLFIAGIAIAVTYSAVRDWQSVDYPGARTLSEHVMFTIAPVPLVRQDRSYRTRDDFTDVYNWYSSRFRLGPEKQAQSQCTHLGDSTTRLGMKRSVSVTLCDTPNGRMMFVQRSTSLDLP